MFVFEKRRNRVTAITMLLTGVNRPAQYIRVFMLRETRDLCNPKSDLA
jgi:hypothetical protein